MYRRLFDKMLVRNKARCVARVSKLGCGHKLALFADNGNDWELKYAVVEYKHILSLCRVTTPHDPSPQHKYLQPGKIFTPMAEFALYTTLPCYCLAE